MDNQTVEYIFQQYGSETIGGMNLRKLYFLDRNNADAFILEKAYSYIQAHLNDFNITQPKVNASIVYENGQANLWVGGEMLASNLQPTQEVTIKEDFYRTLSNQTTNESQNPANNVTISNWPILLLAGLLFIR